MTEPMFCHGGAIRTEASPYGTDVSAWHLSVTDVTWAALAVTRDRGADLMYPLARVLTD